MSGNSPLEQEAPQDAGACLTAPGSHASHEAPKGLRPSGFDPSRYHAQQRLWLQGMQHYQRSGWVIVHKVGRKWVSLRWEEGNYDAGRVELGATVLDAGGYASNEKLYASPEAYEAERNLDLSWRALLTAINNSYSRPKHLTAAKIAKIAAIFRDSDGSGEAGETGTGSTEGDSAGRQASTDQSGAA
ncbi:hypothetical protein [Sphingomonas sp.]|jgi:hypothetical protein|uniref:beta barrel domain-containing protein n=1 Tax=Sphingomonas sp. TaxID=28214 RepID=UPI0035C82FEF